MQKIDLIYMLSKQSLMMCDIRCEQYSFFRAVVSNAITYSSVIVYKKYLILYRCLNKERKKRNFDDV